MLSLPASTPSSLILLVFFVSATSAISQSLPLLNLQSGTPFLSRRQNGNQDASGDLYGIGLRTGAYLQILGMLLSCIRSAKRSRAGIKLLSSAICLSLLVSLTVLIYHRNISPSEGWLILSLINAYGTPRGAAINSSGKKSGGVAVLFGSISVIWQDVLLIWFFTTVIKSLPMLGTANRAWIFAPVDLLGGFRIVMIIYGAVCCLGIPTEVACCLGLVAKRFKEWTMGLTGENMDGELNEPSEPPGHWTSKLWSTSMASLADLLVVLNESFIFRAIQKANKRYWDTILQLTVYKFKKFNNWDTAQDKLDYAEKWVRTALCLWGLTILALTIAGIEMIIQYNGLRPQNDLWRPGQIIPFVLGIITFIEGAASALMPKPLSRVDEIRRSSDVTVGQLEGRMPSSLMEQGAKKEGSF